MNRIEARFEQLREQGEVAFIPYITAGDPTLSKTAEILQTLAQAGADVIELGIPFSEPVGDGPVIQEATLRALQQGTTPEGVIALVKQIRASGCDVPILLFSYFNPILAMGFDTFAAKAKEAGADGVLCVDLPVEEADAYREALTSAGLATVFLVSPTTRPERMRRILEACSGFVYCVSRLGVTGERTTLPEDLHRLVRDVRSMTQKPVAIGFGIAKPEQATEVARIADGVVVGSALVRFVAAHASEPGFLDTLHTYAHAFKQAVRAAHTVQAP